MLTIVRDRVGFIGFGEAAAAFVEGWDTQNLGCITAYDVKTDTADAGVREAKRADYARSGVDGRNSMAQALAGRQVVFSLVTADQALMAAKAASAGIPAGAFYLDCNSCAPGTKRRSALLIERAGGRYVDVAVMAPVRPALHRTPLLVSGPHAAEACQLLDELDMKADVVEGEIGASSSVKMIRSVFVKGLEALVAEGLLAACEAGVDERVLDSLEASYPGFGWKERAGYMLERMMTHGIRRAAEMREVVLTVDELGLESDVARATTTWQERIGELRLQAIEGGYRERARLALEGLRRKHERQEQT